MTRLTLISLTSALLLPLAQSAVQAQNVDASARRPARPDLLRVERPVFPAASGPNRLDVDAALLAAAEPFHVMNGAQYGAPRYVGVNGLSDFRLYTTDGREVPYVLIPPYAQEPQWWPTGKPLSIPATDTASGLEADLGRLLRVDRLEVQGAPSKFLKRVRLEGSGDRIRWIVLAAEATLFSLPDEELRQLTLDFPAGEYRYFRLTWDDRNSARIGLPSGVNVRMTLPPGLATTHLSASIPFERIASEPRVSRFRLRMPAARMPIMALELSVDGGNLLRTTQVYEQVIRGGATGRAQLGSGMLRRAVLGGVAASELRIPVAQPTTAELELVVQDGDNPPLALTGVTAVFAMLPYIYFEAPSAEQLVARYGGESIDWPRYDLEAVKDSVYTMKPAIARWGEPQRVDLQVVAASQGGDSVAQPAIPARGTPMDPLSFRWRRAISGGPAGPAVAKLDAAVLAHTRRGDDLRILDAEHRQVAYLLERVRDSTAIDLDLSERISEVPASGQGRATRYRLKIPYTGLPEGQLVLSTTQRVFRRRVWVEAHHPAGRARREPWVERVTESEWRHDEPGTVAPPLTMRFPTVRAGELHLVVDEGDNMPLVIASARLLLPGQQLRFVRGDSAPLTLVYGNRDLERPQYDLALLQSRISNAAAAEATLGPEESVSPRAPSAIPLVAFWAILGVAVVAMLFMIWRLVGRVQHEAGEEPAVKERV